MKSLRFFSMILIGSYLFLSMFCAHPAYAILGDIDGDGDIDINDPIYFGKYLFENGPAPVVRNDADVDNCPGLTYGDIKQITGYLFNGKQLFPSEGTDLVVPSRIKITTGWVTPSLYETSVTQEIRINTVNQPDLYNLVIPLSYQHFPGQTELNCTDVDFTGTLIPSGSEYVIDSSNKKVLIFGRAEIPSGSDGVIAKINFEVVTPGSPTEIRVTHFHPDNTIILISKEYYEIGDPPGRLLLPEFFTNYIGEVGCDGKVSVSDVVYLINYLFKNGPPPCDP